MRYTFWCCRCHKTWISRLWCQSEHQTLQKVGPKNIEILHRIQIFKIEKRNLIDKPWIKNEKHLSLPKLIKYDLPTNKIMDHEFDLKVSNQNQYVSHTERVLYTKWNHVPDTKLFQWLNINNCIKITHFPNTSNNITNIHQRRFSNSFSPMNGWHNSSNQWDSFDKNADKNAQLDWLNITSFKNLIDGLITWCFVRTKKVFMVEFLMADLSFA